MTDEHTMAPSRPASRATGHLADIEHVAEWLIATHVPGWRFRWDDAYKRAGQCNHTTRTLSFSRRLMANWTPEACRNTILHEIAHALTPGHGHDLVWARKCRVIGGDGQRNWSADEDRPGAPMTYTGTCPNGHEHGRMRLPKAKESCGRCSRRFNPDYLITYTRRSA